MKRDLILEIHLVCFGGYLPFLSNTKETKDSLWLSDLTKPALTLMSYFIQIEVGVFWYVAYLDFSLIWACSNLLIFIPVRSANIELKSTLFPVLSCTAHTEERHISDQQL